MLLFNGRLLTAGYIWSAVVIMIASILLIVRQARSMRLEL